MQRFFFHLVIGSARVQDAFGMVLCDGDAARLKRVGVERALCRAETLIEIERDKLVAVEICDELAQVIVLVPVRDAILPDGSEPSPPPHLSQRKWPTGPRHPDRGPMVRVRSRSLRARVASTVQVAGGRGLPLPQRPLSMVHVGPDDEAEENGDDADDEEVGNGHAQVSVAGGPTCAS